MVFRERVCKLDLGVVPRVFFYADYK